MKWLQIILLVILGTALFSCKEDSGVLEITVSYQTDNEDWRRDVGAKVFLFDHSKTQGINIDSMTVGDARSGKLLAKDGGYLNLFPVYEEQAPNHGKIELEVDAGYYLLILASNGRKSFSHKHQHIKRSEFISLEKEFTGIWDNKKGGETW